MIALSKESGKVLILVLMDNQNTEQIAAPRNLCRNVLILVLMDNQNTAGKEVLKDSTRCLNPCSNG